MNDYIIFLYLKLLQSRILWQFNTWYSGYILQQAERYRIIAKPYVSINNFVQNGLNKNCSESV